ncbi:hypothetical protein CK203_054778 [Vitis vinifera]|uniref:Uncharacterized protein n=1 Tax=Vitis vinifera TaxID=29760 RepID=A0A438GIW4_VITVI|nr:hypothetical protein CK203_054778 [Vitis vinifera]
MDIPHEDQSSHYDHEKDKFAYLSMRDRIELGKRQAQQSQWGSKYALNEDMSMKAKLASMARRIEEFELRNVHTEAQPQAMPTSFEYINHPNLTTQPQPQPSMSTSSLEQAILKISKVMEDFVEKVQDSIEKLTNLDIARGKRKLPPQPHHNLQGTNAKRSRKVLKIDTLVGDCYDNSMDQPSIENHKVQDDKGLLEPFKASTSLGKRRETNSLGPNGKDANFVWDPGGIQPEVGGDAKMMKEKEEKREFWTLESNASNGIQIGVEMKKLWSLQENWTELSGNFAHLNPRCEKFRTVRNTSWHTSAISHTSSPLSHRVKQGAKISHTTIQGAKFIPRCENLSSRCINFAHLNPRCEKFRTVRNHLLAHEWHFAHPKPISHGAKQGAKLSAKLNSRCEILILRCENFATVGHTFGALYKVHFLHSIYHFKAWEVRNPMLQTVGDLDLKRRSYGRLKLTMQS